MSRIKQFFEHNPERTALISFVTAGDPSPEHTVPALHALVAGGTDILELGVPFSDPEAEGPAIQASSERALANGVTLHKVLDMVRTFRREDQSTPIVLMGYLNSVLAMPDFAETAQQAGVDGLIMVNLPPEAATEIQAELAAHDIDLIFLIAPTTTDERAQMILQRASGFVYYVSLKGITGADNLRTDEVAARLAYLRQHSQLPMCVGFGIKDAATAAEVAKVADGVVVGSALVQRLAQHSGSVADGAAALQAAAQDLRQGIDQTA
jgi:tryptophan synthase alpha chain